MHMPWPSIAQIPDRIRERDDLEEWSREQWEQFRKVVNALLLEDGKPEDEAIPSAIEVVNAAEGDPTGTEEWVRVHTTGPIPQDGQMIHFTTAYFDRTVEAFEEYQKDLRAAGEQWFPPVPKAQKPHEIEGDGGRRWSDVKDVVALHDELWAKFDWTPGGLEERKAGAFRHFSINVEAKKEDPVTGKVYAPFLKEISPTNYPKDKRAGLRASIERLTASELEGMGLQIQAAEDEQMQVQAAETLSTFIERRIEEAEDSQSERDRLENAVPRDPSTVGQIVTGDIENPPAEVLEAIAEWADVQVSTLREKDGVEVEAAEDEHVQAAHGDNDMRLSKWLNHQLDRFSTPEGGPGPTRAELVEMVANSGDTSVEAVQALAAGEVVYPSDAVISAISEQFSTPEEDIRSGNLETADEDTEETAPEDGELDAKDDGAHEMVADETEGGEASDQGEGESGPEGVAASETSGESAEVVELQERIDELEATIQRQNRAARLNTEQRSAPGEQPLTASEKQKEKQRSSKEKDWSHLSDSDALERAKEELGDEATAAQAVRLARKRTSRRR